MEIREIEAFLVLAEELHFGRTATRLYVSPARVSQLIRGLERRVGARVVERTSREVRLTPVGEQLLREAGPAYERLDRAVAGAQAAARQLTGVLRVGVWQTIRSTLATALCQAFEAGHPGCRARVLVQVPTDLYEPLRRGEVDVLLMRLPAAPDAVPAGAGIVFGPVLSVDDRAVLVARDHPLAGRSEVTLDDVAGYEVMLITRWPQAFGDLWIPPEAPGGRPIRRSAAAPFRYLDEVLDLVSRSHVVHLTVTGLLEVIPRPDLTTVPLSGLPPMHTVLARRQDRAPLVDAFMDSAAAYVAGARPGESSGADQPPVHQGRS